ncbi:MAG TPA: signal peptidase II [Nitrospiraceae bacterium]|nr:signal peptidase II [Nitrospiraceae bacterium]
MKRSVYVSLIVLLIIATDQITKYLVVKYLNPFDTINILPFLNLVSVRNTGGAFGMFRDIGSGFFIGAAIVAIIFVVWLLFKSKEDYLSLSLILGGAIGNLIDRIRFGYVVDFIDLFVGRFHWPAFNVADSALSIGLLLYIAINLWPGHIRRHK